MYKICTFIVFSLLSLYVHAMDKQITPHQVIEDYPQNTIDVPQDSPNLFSIVMEEKKKQLEQKGLYEKKIAKVEEVLKLQEKKIQDLQNFIALQVRDPNYKFAAQTPYGNELKISLLGAFIGTGLYYYNPTFASPFLFLYFFTSFYSSIKLVQTAGTFTSQTPPFKKIAQKQ